MSLEIVCQEDRIYRVSNIVSIFQSLELDDSK
jgi:hypothetical protein